MPVDLSERSILYLINSTVVLTGTGGGILVDGRIRAGSEKSPGGGAIGPMCCWVRGPGGSASVSVAAGWRGLRPSR